MDISGLLNKSNGRKIREVIKVGGDIVNVYEPTKQDVDKILELQEKWKESNDDKALEVAIDGYDVIRTLIPLLTDVSGLEETSDEQLQEIIENPSLLFMQIQQVIETIIAEVFRLVVLSQVKHLVAKDVEVKSEEATLDIVDYAISNAMRETGDVELDKKVYNFVEEANKIMEAHKKKELDDAFDESKKDLDKTRSLVERYKNLEFN